MSDEFASIEAESKLMLRPDSSIGLVAERLPRVDFHVVPFQTQVRSPEVKESLIVGESGKLIAIVVFYHTFIFKL
jgi:hypothetical protein